MTWTRCCGWSPRSGPAGIRGPPTFGFLNGLPTAELSVQAYRAIGVPSYSSAVLCFVPDIATAFYRAVATGDDDHARTLLAEFYLPFVALRDRVPGYAVALVKAGARLRGLRWVGSARRWSTPTPEHVERLAQIIGRAGGAVRPLPGQPRCRMRLTSPRCVTPIAFPDPPLLNSAGVHQPWALRTIIEVRTADGLIGLGETYGDAAAPGPVRRAAAALVGLDVVRPGRPAARGSPARSAASTPPTGTA